MFEGFLPGGNVAPGSPREFTLNELNPVTEYTIRSVICSYVYYLLIKFRDADCIVSVINYKVCTYRVTAENGVSDQDPDSVDGRTATITGSTTEGGEGEILYLE